MRYIYACNKCSVTAKAVVKKKPASFIDYDADKAGWHPKTGEYMFTVYAEMKNIPTSPECPKCKGVNTNRTWTDATGTWYVRGNCYLDKLGAKRDMYRHKLRNDEDPYANMRVAGEVDHMDDKFRRMGINMFDINAKHNAKVRELKAQIKETPIDLNEEERRVVRYLDQNIEVQSQIMSELVDDINKVLSDLTARQLVCQKRNGTFALMAEGRWMAERI